MQNNFKLVVSLILCGILFSNCERSNGSIGSGKFVEDRSELGEKLVFPVVSYTSAWDSIFTRNPNHVVLGNLQDPVFGQVNSSFVTRFMLSKVSPDFGAGTTCDSVKIRIAYTNHYGIQDDSIHLHVYPLITSLIDTVAYYSNDSVEYELPIVDTVLNINTRDTVFNGVNQLSGYLSFDADPAYFQEHIFDASIAGESHFTDNNSFVEEIPGLYFKDVGSGSTVAGYLDLESSGSLIQLYYHTGETDTIPKVFNLTFGQNFGDPILNFNLYEHDYSSAQFDLSMMDTVNGETVSYIQGGSGVRTYLKFPGLDTLIGQNLSINRADLRFHVVQGSASGYRFPNTLLVIQDQDSSQQLIRDYRSIANQTGGGASRTDIREFRYDFNVTRMIHEFVNEREEILPVILAPAATSANLHRVVIGGGMHPVIPAEFNVYYTRSN